MSYARIPEPQLLSIQAIIQKSQFKSKILNDVPVDIKKLFIEQIAQDKQKSHSQKRITIPYQNLYSQTLQPSQTFYNNFNNSKKKIVPPLPTNKNRQVKSQSLNSSKNATSYNQKLHTLQTTRTNSYSRQARRNTVNRNSFNGEQGARQKLKENLFSNQINKQQTKDSHNSNTNSNTNQQQNNNQHNRKHNRKSKFFNTFQYQLVLPDKNSKGQGFKKISSKKLTIQRNIQTANAIVNNSYQPQSVINTEIQYNQQPAHESQKMQPKYQHQPKKNLYKQPHIKIVTQSQKQLPTTQTIPDFVLSALTKQAKKPSPSSPSKNIQPAQCFQFALCEQKKGEQRIRLLRPPPNVLNMKKKISYNKIRRSQQSCQYQQKQIIQPKVNFIRLIQKQRQKQRQKQKLQNFVRKNSQIMTRQNSREKKTRNKEKDKDKVSQFAHKRSNRKINSEEEVKGWDVLDGPQFFDQY